MSFRVLGVGLVVSMAIIACSSGTTTTTSGGTGAGGSDAQAFIADLCGTVAPCCATLSKPTDGAACRALYGALTAADAYDPSAGSQCLGELHAVQGNSDFCTTFTGSSPSCKGAFHESGSATGTKQLGDTCSASSECLSSSEGDVTCASTFNGSAETKTCQAEIHGKEGDTPCNETRDGTNTSFSGSSSGTAGAKPPPKVYYCDVADGLYCGSGSTGTTPSPAKCTKISAVGGACDGFANEGCTKDAFCDFSTKKCATRIALGGDCSKSSTSCVAKAYCTMDTRKCASQLPAAATCTTSQQCESNRCVNTKCESSNSDNSTSLQLLCGGN